MDDFCSRLVYAAIQYQTVGYVWGEDIMKTNALRFQGRFYNIRLTAKPTSEVPGGINVHEFLNKGWSLPGCEFGIIRNGKETHYTGQFNDDNNPQRAADIFSFLQANKVNFAYQATGQYEYGMPYYIQRDGGGTNERSAWTNPGGLDAILPKLDLQA